MRIDLIPDLPAEPVSGQKRVVIAPPTRKFLKPVSKTAISNEDAKYQALLQSIYDAAIVCDMEGRISDVNMRAVEFFAYSRDDFTHLMIFDIVSGSDESLIRTLRNNLENERFTLIQAYCIRSDGTYFPAEIAVNVLNLGGVPSLCLFVRDITVRKQAEEMLRTEHNAIQNSGNGIAVANLDAKLEYVNPAVAMMWGYEATDVLLGSDVREFMADRNAADQMVNIVLKEQQTWSGEIKAHRHDGSEFDVQISAACNRNSDGEPVGLVFSFVDISDRKVAESAIREAERQRVMLESLGAACHHLGQPATVLLANLGIMHKKINPDTDFMMKELVTSSISAAETLGDILHKLNTVNEYKTTRYLEGREGPDSAENRILEI